LSPNVSIESLSDIHETILMHNVHVGPNCHIYRAIIEQDTQVPAGTEIGVDLGRDRLAGHYVSNSGIVVVSASVGTKPNGSARTARHGI
jgi:glucose-1-phosphate adenylyltransferase